MEVIWVTLYHFPWRNFKIFSLLFKLLNQINFEVLKFLKIGIKTVMHSYANDE